MTAPAKITPAEELKNLITKMEGEFKKTLPPHIPVERFIRILNTALQMNPDLAIANRGSFFSEALKCAQDGLLPDGREALLQTFKTKDGPPSVKYMPMTTGLLKKIRNSGEMSSMTLQCVKEKDKFEYWIDETGEHLKHIPLMTGDRGKLTHAYMIAKMKDGGMYFEIMDFNEIEQVRNVSRAKDSGPWRQWYEEMAKKTVLRRGSKRLPMSTDLDSIIKADDEIFMPETTEPVAVEPKVKSSRLSKIVAETAVETTPTETNTEIPI